MNSREKQMITCLLQIIIANDSIINFIFVTTDFTQDKTLVQL